MSCKPLSLLELLMARVGKPRVQVLADIKTGAVVHVGIEWDDNPDVQTRIERASAIVELIKELRKGAAC